MKKLTEEQKIKLQNIFDNGVKTQISLQGIYESDCMAKDIREYEFVAKEMTRYLDGIYVIDNMGTIHTDLDINLFSWETLKELPKEKIVKQINDYCIKNQKNIVLFKITGLFGYSIEIF